MATIGQQLPNPEQGWKRYDNIDSNIAYSPKFSQSTYFTNGRYGENTAVLGEIDNNEFIKFNFTGDKIRLYGAGYSDLSGENDVIIDGVIYHQNYRFTSNIIALSFELTNLTNKQHSVIIKSGTCARIYLDSIDIDENGKLKPYNDKIQYYFLKYNSQYHTIKGNNLLLLGNQILDKNNFETNGFENLGLITQENTFYEETKQTQNNVFEFNLNKEIKKIEMI